MKERPILFSAPMVRAILDGRKTQTRRVVKGQEFWGQYVKKIRQVAGLYRFEGIDLIDKDLHGNDFTFVDIRSPYGHPGERLWVRESWNHSNFPFGPYEQNCDVFYRADYFDDPLGTDLERSEDGIRRTWKSPIHMPRSASRITLEITGVRVERLQDISEADAIAEGCNATLYIDDGLGNRVPPKGNTIRDSYPSARHWYASTWDDINGPGSWSANPWVWVIEFKRVL